MVSLKSSTDWYLQWPFCGGETNFIIFPTALSFSHLNSYIRKFVYSFTVSYNTDQDCTSSTLTATTSSASQVENCNSKKIVRQQQISKNLSRRILKWVNNLRCDKLAAGCSRCFIWKRFFMITIRIDSISQYKIHDVMSSRCFCNRYS